MIFAALIFSACLTIHSGHSSILSGNSGSRSGTEYDSEGLVTCPKTSSSKLSVQVFRSSRGEWLTSFVASNKVGNVTRSIDIDLERNVTECGGSRYVRISGLVTDKNDYNYSGPSVGDDGSNGNADATDTCRRGVELPTKSDMAFINRTLEESLAEIRKSSDRIENVENALEFMKEVINRLKSMMEEYTSHVYAKQKIKFAFDVAYRGRTIDLSCDLRTATRKNPKQDGYGEHAGVITNVHIEEDRPFLFRIDETIERWSEYGFSIGVTNQKREEVVGAWSVLNTVGTWSILTWKDGKAGKSHKYRDGKAVDPNSYPLDLRHLTVGTILGICRRSNGNLHFYVNGEDRGVAFFNVPKDVYAFVDVRFYVTKVTIVN